MSKKKSLSLSLSVNETLSCFPHCACPVFMSHHVFTTSGLVVYCLISSVFIE